MSKIAFDAALTYAYKKACRIFGAEFAGSAIISAINRGPDSFANQQKVLNYVMMSAKRDRQQARIRNKAHAERDQDNYLDEEGLQEAWGDDTFNLDVMTAIKDHPPDIQEALEAYFLQGESISSAALLIKGEMKHTTKRYWLKAEVDRIVETRLKDYKK